MMDIVSGVGVLDKSMQVVEAIAQQPLNLAELQQVTGLPRATAHRLASALVDHGMLRRRDDQCFDLGPALATLGRIAASRHPLLSVAEPILQRLRLDTAESVQLFVIEGQQRRCIRSLPSTHALQWIVPDGALYPLSSGSAGRVLCGETGPDGWVATVAEREPGVASVSAPVVFAPGAANQIDDQPDVVAAVSVSGPIERLGAQPGMLYGGRVAAAAAEISAALAAR